MNPYFAFLLLKRIKGLKFLMKDPAISKWYKALVIFGIIYLISPIDLIPFPVLGFGLLDDLAVWIFILSFLGEQLDKYQPKDYSKKYKGKKVIDDIDFEVKKENTEEKDEEDDLDE